MLTRPDLVLSSSGLATPQRGRWSGWWLGEGCGHRHVTEGINITSVLKGRGFCLKFPAGIFGIFFLVVAGCCLFYWQFGSSLHFLLIL